MDPTAALVAGLVAGLAIAMQVGAVSLLLIEAAVVAGPRAGVAAGMGVATVDFAFAAVAAAAGGAAGAGLASHEGAIKIVAGAVLAAIAVHGLLRAATEARGGAESRAASETRSGDAGCRVGQREADKVDTRRHYGRFLALTAANPLTSASFAAVAAALSLDGPAAAVAFTAGVGVASAAWHLALSLAAGHAGRWMTDTIRRGLGIGGRVVVLVIAAHLALGA